VRASTLGATVQFDATGNPTNLKAVTDALAKMEPKQDPSSIKLYYFKTSDADALRMKQWIQNAYQTRKGWGLYLVGVNDCRSFAWRALHAGGVSGFPTNMGPSNDPNDWMEWMFDKWSEDMQDEMRESVTHRILYPQSEAGSEDNLGSPQEFQGPAGQVMRGQPGSGY
jgi:hypothetical protein